MARIRTIKPEFWADEKVGPLDPITRLVFLGLISMADDEGRILDSVKQIDAFVFPYTEHTCHGSLIELAVKGRIRRGETASGQRVIQIVHWRHQKINRPNKKGALPPIAQAVTGDSVSTHGSVSEDSRIHTYIPTTNDQLSTINDRAVVDDGEIVGVVIGQPAEYALAITIAANHAVTKRWGEQTTPYVHGQSYDLTAVLQEAGVPLDTAKFSIASQCERLNRSAPPKSINYFRPGIVADYEVEKQIAIQAKHPPQAGASGDVWDRWIAQEKAKEAAHA